MPFPVDELFVVETEQKLGVRFPDSFRRKMQVENGGEVSTTSDDWQLYPIRDTSDKKRLKRTCNDIVHETTVARTWTGFPSEAVAIGSNGTGDQLVLIPSSGEEEILHETIFWWDHETGALSKIAESIDSLK